jgi:hypothetical protein
MTSKQKAVIDSGTHGRGKYCKSYAWPVSTIVSTIVNKKQRKFQRRTPRALQVMYDCLTDYIRKSDLFHGSCNT